jgi:large subunit ribosomal protein L29
MKASEIRQMTPAEIETKLEDLQKEYLNLRFGMATQQLESSAKLRMARRDIARVLTIINEKGKKA